VHEHDERARALCLGVNGSPDNPAWPKQRARDDREHETTN
jgi:hypothetical protein